MSKHKLDKGSTPGYKQDMGKPEWSLLPFDAVRCVVEVLTTGAKKYNRHNWRGGMVWSRPYDALMRHLSAWWEGEDIDIDSGHHHLSLAMCEIMFLLYYSIHARYKQHDDRFWPNRRGDSNNKTNGGSS